LSLSYLKTNILYLLQKIDIFYYNSFSIIINNNNKTLLKMNSSIENYYYSLYKPDISSDHLSNAEYKIFMSEPNYTLLVVLYKILPKDVIQFITTYSTLLLDLAGRTLRRLDSSIDKCIFDDFKMIYDNEYMPNPNICNFFEFTEVNLYHLCECNDNNEAQISRNFYIKKCQCQNGKRFLAFKMIHNAAYQVVSTNYYERDMKKTDDDVATFNRMIDYVIDSGPIDEEYCPIFEPRYY